MVSLITRGRSTDDEGRPFARRRHRPWLVFVAVVALLGAIVWIRALTKGEASTTTVSCNSPTANATGTSGAPGPVPLGERVSSSMLHDVEPAPLSATKVRVYNANGQRGQAAHIASQLSEYGFASAPGVQVGNDPIYVDQNLQCSGQIRFGPKGRAAAATVQLVAPCDELIEDRRTDDTVDLALGTYSSNDLSPNNDAEEVLRSLKDSASGTTPPPLDLKLLQAARSAKC